MLVPITWSKIKANMYAIDTEKEMVYSFHKKAYLNISFDKDGYKRVCLVTSAGVRSSFGIHRLLMVTFRPCENIDEMVVNHIDGNKLNNSLDNLEWVTSSKNVRLAHETGLNNTKGENHGKSKLTEKQVLRIIQLSKEGKGLKEIRKEIPCLNRNMLNLIKHGHTWKHLPR